RLSWCPDGHALRGAADPAAGGYGFGGGGVEAADHRAFLEEAVRRGITLARRQAQEEGWRKGPVASRPAPHEKGRHAAAQSGHDRRARARQAASWNAFDSDDQRSVEVEVEA